jgi:putative SOS response-associated peptidase YedK
VPYYIRVRCEPIIAFAGLCDHWRNPDGVTVSTFAVVTCRANSLVAPLHERMPVILSRENEERWLDPRPLTPEERQEVLSPCPPGCMEAFPVADRVNSTNADDAGLIRPLPSSAGAQTHLPE